MIDDNAITLTLFVQTRDVRLLQSFDPVLRQYFDWHTLGQPADRFIEAVFKRLETEPLNGEPITNWLWGVVHEEGEKHRDKRLTSETIDAIRDVTENRDAILAIELWYTLDSDELENSNELKIYRRNQVFEWFKERNLIYDWLHGHGYISEWLKDHRIDWRPLVEILAA